MEDRQRKLSKNIGNDTHTRNLGNNMFQAQSAETFKIISGEVFLVQPEPAFTQTAVTVNLTKGGMLTGVAYPGAFVEPVSGNLHGLYEGPFPGQMVMIAFAEGNSSAPFVVNKYPYQGCGDSFTESQYVAPMTRAAYNAMDVVLGHVSGSYLSFNTVLPLPGSVSLHAMTDLVIDAGTQIDISSSLGVNISSTIGAVSVSGGTVDSTATLANTVNGLTVELNGNTKSFVTWLELNTVMQLFITALNLRFGTKLDGAGTAGVFTLDISSAMTTTVLTGG